MRHIAPSEGSGVGNPILATFTQENGILKDPFSLTYEIFDRTVSGAPDSIVAETAVDLVTEKVSTGYFAPTIFLLPLAPKKGLHSVRWSLKWLDDASLPIVYEQPFDIITDGTIKPIGVRLYALLSNLRVEGLAASVSDDRALQALAQASNEIEAYTNRVFGAVAKTFKVDGKGSADLLLPEPIIGISALDILSHAFGAQTTVTNTDLDDVGIYNRHLLLPPLMDPDDRENPKVSFFRLHDHMGQSYRETRPLFPNHVFPFGQQNVQMTGAWGYTEPDGSPMGDVPRLLQRAAALIAARNADPAIQGDDPVPGGPIKRMKTRDQEVEYAVPSGNLGGASPGPYTGDPTIDNLLLMFSRGPTLGAA